MKRLALGQEFVQGLVVGQLEPRYGSTTESDWERAAMPAHAAPAALHRDCSFSASGNGPVPSHLRFSVRLGNVVVADRNQNPAARRESTQTPSPDPIGWAVCTLDLHTIVPTHRSHGSYCPLGALMVPTIQILILLLIIVASVAVVAARVNVPPSILLVLTGVALALVLACRRWSFPPSWLGAMTSVSAEALNFGGGAQPTPPAPPSVVPSQPFTSVVQRGAVAGCSAITDSTTF
jgi:hypothetical protein